MQNRIRSTCEGAGTQLKLDVVNEQNEATMRQLLPGGLVWSARRNYEGPGLWRGLVASSIVLALTTGCIPDLKHDTEGSGSTSGNAGRNSGKASTSVGGAKSSSSGGASSQKKTTDATSPGGATGTGTGANLGGSAPDAGGGATVGGEPVASNGGAGALGGTSGTDSPAVGSGGSMSGAVTTGGGASVTPATTGGAGTTVGTGGAATGGTSTTAPPDTVPPELTAKAPLTTANPTDVVQATFSEPLNCSTVTATSFQVKDATGAVDGTLSCSGNTVTFTPRTGFTFTVSYSVSLTSSIKDAADNGLKDAPQSWTFKGREGAWDSASVALDSSAPGTGPEAAVSLNGDAMVVWSRSVGIVSNAWSSRYTDSSGKWSGAIPIFTSSEDSCGDLRVGADDSGRFVAAWSQGVPGFSTMYDTTVSRIVPGGVWETPKVLSTDSTTSTVDLHLTVQPSGDTSLVWLQHGLPFSTIGEKGPPWGSRFSVSGGTWSSAVQIRSQNCDSISAAGSHNGTVMTLCSADDSVLPITWKSGQSATTGTAIGGLRAEAIRSDGSGNFVALWVDGNSPYSLWANRWYASTTSWGTAVKIRDFRSIEPRPALAVNARGAAVTVWIETIQNDTTPMLMGAYVSGATTQWNWFIEINSGAADTSVFLSDPSVGIDAAGNAIAAWTRNDTVWLSRFAANTSPPAWSTPVRLDQNGASGGRVAMHPTGRALVVWSERESASSDTVVVRGKWFR